MPLTIRFEVSEAELQHYRRLMQEAHEVVGTLSRSDITESACALVQRMRQQRAPSFVIDRLNMIETLTEMIEDEEWKLSKEEDRLVLDALVHFCQPVRLLRDHVPRPGYLDDLLAIELVAYELDQQIHQYEAFRARRCNGAGERGSAPAVSRRRPRSGDRTVSPVARLKRCVRRAIHSICGRLRS